MTQLLVIAKEPIPGQVKTRLCPPCTGGQAARLAAAALEDTLHTVAAARLPNPVLALQGLPGPWLPPGFTVIPQRGRGLDERLAAAFTDAHGLHAAPIVLIGMDTPQLTPALLDAAAEALTRHDAVYGPAADGGFWLLGLRRPDPALLLGVPMSQADTGSAQMRRLREAGLSTALMPELRDVDTYADALHVAAQAPGTRFAATLDAVRVSMATSPGTSTQFGTRPSTSGHSVSSQTSHSS
ncbi:TIGR04282 family arsenosugar biosynthesis glycosyltransferase [Sphaerisporangium aureirubrum]|uniref:TIGR04282 family arsenosugar biosynthesis glycosyltransferase n=1 Tax=Sphaerisporangium aureirubrum TaxID=1544736 RepID=A0ABW1NLX4_9ACTN